MIFVTVGRRPAEEQRTVQLPEWAELFILCTDVLPLQAAIQCFALPPATLRSPEVMKVWLFKPAGRELNSPGLHGEKMSIQFWQSFRNA